MRALFISLLALGLFATSCWLEAATGLGADTKDEAKPKMHRGKITIGRETTFVLGPLDSDGYIDYPAALNELLRQGITPATNANVLLWKALGPHPMDETLPPDFFEWMGIPSPPEKGEYFIDEKRYIKDHLKVDPGKASEEVSKQFEYIRQHLWSAQDYPKMAAWLKANEQPMQIVVEASKRPRYFCPLTPPKSAGLLAAPLSGATAARECVTALTARALLRASQGNLEEAWQDLLACHRLGRLLVSGGTLIEALVGVAIEQATCQADLAFLAGAKPDATRLKRSLDDLLALPPLPPVAEMANYAERFMLLETVSLIDRKGIRYLEMLVATDKELKSNDILAESVLKDIHWDPALKNANRWYDRLVNAMREKDRATRQKKWDEVEEDLKALKEKSIDPNGGLGLLIFGDNDERGEALGNLVIGVLMPAIGKIQLAVDRAQQIHNNLQVAFALEWYERDHGSYPKALDALAPKHLKNIPSDSFSGKALLFRPTEKGYLLYSVGPNGKDDGGRGYQDEPQGDDLRVRMPVPEK